MKSNDIIFSLYKPLIDDYQLECLNSKISSLTNEIKDISIESDEDKKMLPYFMEEKNHIAIEMIRQFIYNLIKAENIKYKVRYSRKHANFYRENYYDKLLCQMNNNLKPASMKSNCRLFIKIADFLEKIGIASQVIGSEESGIQSTITFTPKGKKFI